MTSLRQALEKGEISKFIEKQSDAAKGNKTAFDATISSMAGKSKPVQKTSAADDHDD